MFDFKLGKKAVKFDRRTLKLSNVLNPTVELPPVPDEWDVDKSLGANMRYDVLGNDKWGDCVIVARANATWRFEYFQQKTQIPITLDNVLNEYWSEQGAYVSSYSFINWLYSIFHARPDNGLVMLDSLNQWRKKGWGINNRNYTIHAYASLNITHYNDLQQAVYFLNGAYIGISVTQTCMNQFKNGEIWDISNDNNIIGGHAIYIVAYNKIGPIAITWGKRQQMTWEFYFKYCDEAYALIDNYDSWLENDPIDCEKLSLYLESILNMDV